MQNEMKETNDPQDSLEMDGPEKLQGKEATSRVGEGKAYTGGYA